MAEEPRFRPSRDMAGSAKALYEEVIRKNFRREHDQGRALIVQAIEVVRREERERFLRIVEAVMTECAPPMGVPTPILESWALTRAELKARIEESGG